MKKSLLLGLVSVLALVPIGAHAEDVVMPQEGVQVVTVESGQSINYYDYKGYFKGNTIAGADWQFTTFATTIFKPAKEGDKIKIEFETVKLLADNGYAYVRVYNGVFDTTSVKYNIYGYADFPKTSNMLEELSDGTFENKTYISTDATGALSCCARGSDSEYDKTMGWKATVTALSNDAMKVESAKADYTDVRSDLYMGEQNITLGGLVVTTTGASDADALTGMSFTLDGEVFDVSQLRLCMKKGTAQNPIETTLSKSGDIYTFTCNQAFEAGDNTFYIVGNVQPRTDIETTSTLTVTGLTTKNGYKTLTAAAAKQQTVTEARMIDKQHIYVYVGEDDIPFFDDGGIDGKISYGFEGYVTFLPRTEGQKIQVELANIHIFYTAAAAGFGRADILSFYNGTTAGGDSLLYTFKKEGGKVDNYSVKSTAENGAITVYLRSTQTSESMQGAGFEGVVHAISAQPMQMVSASVTKQNGKVAGCTTGVEIMRFCLTTENTEPALQPTLFHFNTGNTYERVDSATLYYTGLSAEFSTARKVGKVAVTDNTFAIPAEGISLREEENYFFLTYDVACNVQNGEPVIANITQVDFSNKTEYKEFSDSEDALIVNNTLYSDCGQKTIYVYGDWIFTHTTEDEYSGSYKAVVCDQQTTFVPTAEGHIIQMNFTDFAVSYNDYSKATFRIYEGQGTEGKLLWEADADNCAEGPGQVRSSAADGALTVVFNANTEWRTYVGAGKGWHATVSQYKPKPMEVESTSLAAASSEALVRGQKHAEILNLNITTSGDIAPLALDQVGVVLTSDDNQCWNAIDTLFLLQGGKVVAKKVVADYAPGDYLLLTPAIALAEGDNTFTIAVNVKEDAAIDTKVSIEQVIAMDASGNNYEIWEVPENGRIVRNMYSLKSGVQRVEVGKSPLYFYDDGGPKGQITLGMTGTVTFVPTVEDAAIRLRFKKWALNGADNFYVYYGEETKDQYDMLLSSYTKDIDKLVLISTDATGALTVKYDSRGSLASDGWEIEVSCPSLGTLALDSIKVEDVSAAVVNRGSADVKVLRAAVHVSGDRGTMEVGNFNVETTLGAEAVKVYSTGTLDAFSTTTLVDKTDIITNRGTYYYWITLDVPVTTEEGSEVSATLRSVDINRAACTPKNKVTATFEVIGGMHGTYRVGTSREAKYKTIQSAIDALQGGIESAVTFLIEPGTYTEYITIPEINGVSAENVVTFRSLTGNREDVVITYDNYSPVSTPDGEQPQGIFTFDGADYVTLSNLTLTTGSESYHAVVMLRNRSEHVTIDSCLVYRAANIATPNVRLVYATAQDGTTTNNYFTLSHSTLRGGYTGVNISGNRDNKQVGAHVIGNTFEGQGAQAVIVSLGEVNAVIDGNTVRKTLTGDKSAWCIDVRLSEGAQISNNYIYVNVADEACHGLYIRDINGTETAPARIYNNVVNITNTAADKSYGIYFNKSVKNVILANNTVRTSGAAVYPLFVSTSSTNLQVINNLLYSSNQPAAWVSAADYVSKSEHNLLYSEGSKFGKIDSDEYGDIAAWRIAIGGTTDITETVRFESAEVLRPVDKGNLVSAEVLDFITTDITGRNRAVVPTIGAYEWIDKTGTGCRSSETTTIRVFPTITCDMLNISGAEGATVRVMSTQGQVLMHTALTADAATLDVTVLPQGTYLLDVNGTVFRFIKQ